MAASSPNGLIPVVVALILVALAGLLTPAMAGQPVLQDPVLDAIAKLQMSVKDLQTKVGQIPPAWSQTLPDSGRFQLVMGNKAALDKETGLVWEQSPSGSPQNWFSASERCLAQMTGGRGGWRLPTIQEMGSLLRMANGLSGLPTGHPFKVQSDAYYWSATTVAKDNTLARGWRFLPSPILEFGNKQTDQSHLTWCVRGGQGVDLQ